MKRRVWLLAAGALFARSGLRVTQAQIAAAAGVGVASVYRRFQTKDELILRVYQSRLHEAVELATAAAALPNPWDGLEYFLRHSAQVLAEDVGFRDLTPATMKKPVHGPGGTPTPTSRRP